MQIFIFIPLILSILLVVVSWRFQTKYMVKNYKQYFTVSHMYHLKEFRGSFKKGLILTGILQILFVLSISFPEEYYSISFGKIAFIIGGIGAILLGLYSLTENFIIHEIASFMYFFGLAIGATYITIQSSIPDLAKVLSLSIVFIWVLSIFYEGLRKNGVFAIETIHVLLSYFWIILIGVTHIIVIL